MIRLFELRTERELSQREMAKALNVSQGTYNNWENSNTQPSIEQLIALSSFFGVSVDYIIGNTDDFGVMNLDVNDDRHSILGLFNSASPEMQSAIKTILKECNKK
ncbi:MAG: helix-turn-helix transcriptional regulator [Clostridia bacterium]|nr:helix-turn-helix transcriptional regulator [Clostridia bacterium]